MFLSVEVIGMWYERSWQWAKAHLTITVPGVVLVFAATYVLMLAVNAGEVGAAWVQAVGSVVAILFSVYIARRDSRRANREKKDRDQVQLEVIARVVEAVQADMGSLRSSFPVLVEKKDWTQAHLVVLSSVEMLNALDVTQFASPDVVQSFLHIRNTMRQVLNFVHIMMREPANQGAAASLELNCQLVWRRAREFLDDIESRKG